MRWNSSCPPDWAEGEIAEFVEHDEIDAGEIVRHAALAAAAALGLEAVHQVDDVEEAAAGAIPDAGAGDRDGEMRFAGTGSANQDDIALVGQELAGREVSHESLVEGRSRKGELVDVLGERQFRTRAVPHGHYKITTVIAAVRASGPFAIDLMDGGTNGVRFRAYVAAVLVPALKPGDTVVMDNLAADKVAGIRQLIQFDLGRQGAVGV